MSQRTLLLVCVLLLFAKVSANEFTLNLNNHERRAISEIVTTMGEKNIARLLLDSTRLTGLGNSIEHVPPLQFLGFILSDPYLKDCLRQITLSYFKWSPFIDGFGNNMNVAYVEGSLFKDLIGFSKLVNGNLSLLEMYTYQRDWEQFVKCLL